MKRWLAVICILSLVLWLLIGCSSETVDSDNDEITIRYFAFSPGEAHEKDLQAMIRAFEQKNPGIKVKYELASFNDYFTKLQSQIAGGNPPDTFELNYENFVSYAAKGALLKLDEMIQADQNFDLSSLNQQAYEAFRYDDKQYGMVESFSNVVLFYNKDLFDAAGVSYPEPSWTWKDELQAAQRLTDREKRIWGTFSPIQFWEFYKTIAQNGGAVFNQDQTKVTLNSRENIEALQWMVDKVNRYQVTPSDLEMSGQLEGDLFKEGRIAMLRTGSWMFDSFKDVPFDWDIALEPGNIQKAHHFFANGLAISRNTKHQEAAWKWIKFMSVSEEAVKIRVESSWELPAVGDQTLVEDYLKKSPPQSRQVIFEALDTLVVPPVIERWSEMTDIIDRELELVKLGQKTPEEALTDANNYVRNLMN
ncbi:ABC transporter substrate-binding protein [Alkaliphilus crotonatoxidans]